MNKHDEINKEIRDHAPSLGRSGPDTGFGVPEGYFEALPDAVMKALEKEQETLTARKKSGRIVSMRHSWWKMGIAASFALLIGLGIWSISDGTKNTHVELTDISLDEINSYVQQNIVDFDEGLLMESVDLEMVDIPFTENIKESQLEQYIDDMIDDVDLYEVEQLL